jgi:hypothetical protein
MSSPITQILDDLRHGVPDQTWAAYAQQLKALGAPPLHYDNDENGMHKYEISVVPGQVVHVERGPSGLWRLA